MKTYTIVITVLFVFLCLLGITGIIEHRKEDSLDQARIEGLKKQNAKERDSLNTQLAITRDSLEVAFATIRQARIESQEAHERTQRIIKKYEQIIFIRYSSDSARHRKLSELYSTYVIP